jgi:hypothetical protein
MINLYTCPVCAYPEMTDPVEEGNICPCCGTEFGYDDDLDVTYRQLRDRWFRGGAQWFSPATERAADWDPIRQLIEADYEFDMIVDERAALTEFPAELIAA